MKTETSKWLARLSSGERRDLKQLQEKFNPLSQAFDRLLPIIGLWSSFQLGPLHRILTLKCPEVNTSSLITFATTTNILSTQGTDKLPYTHLHRMEWHTLR
jgi:hypothetical protein